MSTPNMIDRMLGRVVVFHFLLLTPFALALVGVPMTLAFGLVTVVGFKLLLEVEGGLQGVSA